ncbi:hypothetical protein R3W88_027117 [Solanum pinnatisectum]|uniref:Uncharacterized protein n=1 Tax=Solanum pinnatisectum TaxID=50273 RepID=A0AAV9LFV3_9SOLN|nr:hypothetical protein R3W88_027117 [Solanum pinnatisectum]
MHGTLMLLHQTGIYLDEIWFPAFDSCSTHWEDAHDVMMVSSPSHLEYERSVMRRERERERERARRLIQKDLLIVVFLLDLEIYPQALYHVSLQS